MNKEDRLTLSAIKELEKLSLSLASPFASEDSILRTDDTVAFNLEQICSMTIEDVEKELRQIGIDPDQPLPESIRRRPTNSPDDTVGINEKVTPLSIVVSNETANRLTSKTYNIVSGVRSCDTKLFTNTKAPVRIFPYVCESSAGIPIISVAGTNGKTTVCRLLNHIVTDAGRAIAMMITDGLYSRGRCVIKGEEIDLGLVRRTLSEPSLDAAILEVGEDTIAHRGLGYDQSDISVITNLQFDHIDQCGIGGIDDLTLIKELVSERVKDGGTLILNADDVHLAQQSEILDTDGMKKKIVYFSLHQNHLIIKRHLTTNGLAYFIKKGWIVEASGGDENRIIKIPAIPMTLGGAAEFNVANVLAAIAACRAYGLSIEQVASSMLSFQSESHNLGRTNIYQIENSYLILDSGHNPDAYKSICRMASLLGERRITGVIGMPSDRADSVIKEAGKVAANGFHHIIIKENKDLRGRLKGEIAGLLCQAIKDEVPNRQCSIILNEVEAIDFAIQNLVGGEILVVFYNELKAIKEILDYWQARPIEKLNPRLGLKEVFFNRLLA